VTFAAVVWPGFGSDLTVKWVVGICMALILIVSWSMVECIPCKTTPVRREVARPIRKRVVRRTR